MSQYQEWICRRCAGNRIWDLGPSTDGIYFDNRRLKDCGCDDYYPDSYIRIPDRCLVLWDELR